MEVMFDIKQANKAGIDSPEHNIVENDVGAATPYHNQSALLAAAKQTANSMNTSAGLMQDPVGRQCLEFSPCEYLSDVYRASQNILTCLMSQRVAQTQVNPEGAKPGVLNEPAHQACSQG